MSSENILEDAVAPGLANTTETENGASTDVDHASASADKDPDASADPGVTESEQADETNNDNDSDNDNGDDNDDGDDNGEDTEKDAESEEDSNDQEPLAKKSKNLDQNGVVFTKREKRLMKIFHLNENEIHRTGKKKMSFFCKKCKTKFSAIHFYYRHREICGIKNPPIKVDINDNWCSLCREQFSNSMDLIGHYASSHQGLQFCSWCTKGFSSMKKVLEHQRTCGSKSQRDEVMVNIAICPNCRKMFTRRIAPNAEPLRDLSTRTLCYECVIVKEVEMHHKIGLLVEDEARKRNTTGGENGGEETAVVENGED